MTAERETQPAKSRGLVNFVTRHLSAERRTRWTRRGMRRIIDNTPCKYPKDYPVKVKAAALKGGIMYAQSHTRNSDIPVGVGIAAEGMKYANEVLPEDRQISGIIEPFAWSLKSGAQKEMSTMYDDGINDLKAMGLEPNPTPTRSDLAKGRVTEEVFHSGRKKAGLRMVHAVWKENKMIVVPPEATVKAGDIDEKTGKPFGMQEFDFDALYVSLRTTAARTGIATLFAISVSNSLGVLNSQNKPTKRALFISALPDSIFSKIKKIASIMKATVSEPIEYTETEIMVIGPALINQRIGNVIAAPLKPKERGFYGEKKKKKWFIFPA
jgi:hypothetical protein